MNLTTYQSAKAWPEKRWLAHMELGKGVYMSFFGKTEEEALAKANDFWQRETERQKALMADAIAKPKPVEAATDEVKSEGRGAHFVGKVWMIHNHTRQKIRIDSSEVSLYEGRGYVRGGPRSK